MLTDISADFSSVFHTQHPTPHPQQVLRSLTFNYWKEMPCNYRSENELWIQKQTNNNNKILATQPQKAEKQAGISNANYRQNTKCLISTNICHLGSCDFLKEKHAIKCSSRYTWRHLSISQHLKQTHWIGQSCFFFCPKSPALTSFCKNTKETGHIIPSSAPLSSKIPNYSIRKWFMKSW